jgi:hypothetical protein
MAHAALLLLAAVSIPAAFGALRPASSRAAESPSPAVLRDGVAWVDQGRVLFQGFHSGVITLGGVSTSASPVLESSGNAVVIADAAEGFGAGIPPGRLAPVEEADEETPELEGGGCSDWTPQAGSTTEAPSDFAVADAELIDAGVCQAKNGGFGEQELATAQPLFIHRLRGRGWRVLRWLEGHEAPVLATEGSLLAIGDRESAHGMHVTVLDLASGGVVTRFAAPLGGLSFASSRRLVVSVREGGKARASSGAAAPGPEVQVVVRPVYRLELYTLTGQPLAYIGTADEPALVSRMHLLVNEEVEGHSVLAVRNILDGSTRRLIGFREPARTLEAVAFRWPAVAVIETTSVPLTQSEVTCYSGEYHQSSPPLLRIFDLARPETYVPPPPSPHLAPPAGPCRLVVPPKTD